MLNGGANYVATFVVAAPPVVVGVPAFARGPGETVDLPNTVTGDDGGIPLNLSSGAGVTAGKFVLQYNSALLTITGAMVNAGLTGASMTLDPSSTPGNAVIDFSTPTALAAGVVRLGTLQALVPNSTAANYKAKTLLHFASEQLNGGNIAVVGDDAVQVVAYPGDAFGTGVLGGIDSSLISPIAVQLDTGFAAFPLLDPAIIGDLSSDGHADGALSL